MGDENKRRKRTLLFVTNAFSYGGSEKHLLELLSRLKDSNIEVTILSTDSDPFTERLDEECRSFVNVLSQRASRSTGDWRRVFKKLRPDVVVLIYGTLWMLPWIAAVAARLVGVQRLYAIHHLMPIPPNEPPVLRIRSARDIWKRIFGKRVRVMLGARIPAFLCKKTICVSNAVRDALIRDYQFPKRKMLTVHNGISLAEFAPGRREGSRIRAKFDILPDEFVLTCTTRLSKEKGVDILVSAMSLIVRDHSECKCIIVGDGYLKEELSKQIESLKLARNVFMEDFQADVRPYLVAADVFVLTSHVEGLPYSVLEAMGCGLPCVVTDVGGNSEAVLHNANGLLVSPGSVDAVAKAILFLLTHPEERLRMARASRLRAQSEFDIEPRMADIKRLILS